MTRLLRIDCLHSETERPKAASVCVRERESHTEREIEMNGKQFIEMSKISGPHI